MTTSSASPTAPQISATSVTDGDRRPDDARREERITTEGPVYTVTGGDWDTLLDD